MKSYTDLEQSKKLTEFLPVESADMLYWMGEYITHSYMEGQHKDEQIPIWSLAALLGLLPKSAQLEKGNITELYRVSLPVELEASDWYIDPIDACVEMILKLNKLGLL